MTYVYKERQYVAAGGHGFAGTKPGDYLIAYGLTLATNMGVHD